MPSRLRGRAAWLVLLAAVTVPVVIAATSPLQLYRDASYVAASVSGVAALALFLVQPLLAGGYLPGLSPARTRRWHRALGLALVALVAVHVGGLYLTSPPDTLDALMLVSPTPFSIYGVLALWSLVAAALLVAVRKRVRATVWRVVHNGLAVIAVVATVVHALMIEGAMGPVSKVLLCVAVVVVTLGTVVHLRIVRPRRGLVRR